MLSSEDKVVCRFFSAFFINDNANTNFIDTMQVVLFILGAPSKVNVRMKHILL